MLEDFFSHFAALFQHYGYWAVFLILFLENAGLPLPGETSLLYASFLASQGPPLRLYGVILVAFAAAVCGDSAGYWLGRRGGPRVAHLLRLTPPRLALFRRFFARYGRWTIFFARFVAGLRIIAGPAAGLCGMSWPQFFTYNALGGLVWVHCIAFAGYFLGSNWPMLLSLVKRFNIAAAILAVIVLVIMLRRHQRA